jgi:hypothetical protein
MQELYYYIALSVNKNSPQITKKLRDQNRFRLDVEAEAVLSSCLPTGCGSLSVKVAVMVWVSY